ncbi:MAG: glycosyltransferase family 2 protein [Candidatus Helarchaeota archaeon]|nr:glycosyltransferase family 2 protein [Candidatus Helarchaeota archaeon]
MGKIRYLISGSILVGLFAIIHWLFPRDWSRWLQRVDNLLNETLGFKIFFGFGLVLFFSFVLLYGISFMASFGKADYPKGSENVTPPISILMPAINEEKIIRDTIISFINTSYPKDKLELIIIASGSEDKTVEICREYQDRLNMKVLTDPLPKKGKPAALNFGLKHTSHDIICVYDADTHLYENTLQYLVRHFHDSEVAATCAPVMIRNLNTNKLTKGIALEYTFLSGTGLYFEIRNRLGRNLWILGRNYSIRKEIIEEFGGWNEDALTEDLHLSSQLSAAKKKIKFAPHAFISENAPTTYEAFKHQRRRWVGGYKQGLNAAMELDRRTVLLRNFGMMHFGNAPDFSLGALITALILGLTGYFYLMLLCLTVFCLVFGMIVNAVRKYGGGKYRLLIYYLVFIFINMFMFINQFRSIKDLEWEKTTLE